MKISFQIPEKKDHFFTSDSGFVTTRISGNSGTSRYSIDWLICLTVSLDLWSIDWLIDWEGFQQIPKNLFATDTNVQDRLLLEKEKINQDKSWRRTEQKYAKLTRDRCSRPTGIKPKNKNTDDKCTTFPSTKWNDRTELNWKEKKYKALFFCHSEERNEMKNTAAIDFNIKGMKGSFHPSIDWLIDSDTGSFIVRGILRSQHAIPTFLVQIALRLFLDAPNIKHGQAVPLVHPAENLTVEIQK
jgi:hypothetical protein